MSLSARLQVSVASCLVPDTLVNRLTHTERRDSNSYCMVGSARSYNQLSYCTVLKLDSVATVASSRLSGRGRPVEFRGVIIDRRLE